MNYPVRFLLLSALLLAAMSAGEALEAVEKAKTDGFLVPECCLYDAGADRLFVSNIEAEKDAYWADDDKGFISLLRPEGGITKLRWTNSTPQAPLHAPKGMCLFQGRLFFSDNSRLLHCDARTGEDVRTIKIKGAEQLNDLASDATHVYVTDTKAGRLYRVDAAGAVETLPAPESVNGVTVWQGRVFLVSWALHEVYELTLDPKPTLAPFGLAAHFTNLDGIEVLADGSFIVSDFKGNKVSHISADRKQVRTLITVDSPADIGLNRKEGLLYVPSFMTNTVYCYSLKE